FHGQAVAWIKQLQGWIARLGPWGPLVFILVYIVFTVLALPGTLLTVLAGTLFESPVQAVVFVSMASTTGATLCFVMARYVARDSVARWACKSDKFRRLDEMTEKNGAVIVAITRLVPIFPFNLQNYGYGLTRVRLPTYILFSWLCMLPGTVILVLAPAGLVQGVKEGKVPWPLLAVLFGAIILALVMTYLGKRYLAGREAAQPAATAGWPTRSEGGPSDG
ncbi:MAG: hypothetical protein GWP05_04670, partial [Anaerolineaceae bacterium]|nr:hypothetical protein [Anaerolineaceae bacterium]